MTLRFLRAVRRRHRADLLLKLERKVGARSTPFAALAHDHNRRKQ